jgi:hypothetical protein
MGTYNLIEEIKVLCVTAKSFPDGIIEAYETIEKLGPEMCDRTFFGISSPDISGKIIYKAAVTQMSEREAEKYGLETFIIPKGEYLIETLFNWMDNTAVFAATFQKLLKDPRLDTSFPCLEWYKSNDEVMCMVKLKA